MPKVKLHAIQSDRHGNFYLKFSKHETVDFYGENLSLFEVFRRLGNLPDNNILCNKLINILGRNLLSLEKQAATRNPDEPSNDFADTLERSSNAFTISLLSALAPLEQWRFDSDDKLSLASTPESLRSIKDKLSRLYDARVVALTQQKSGLGASPQDQIKQNRLQGLINRINKAKERTLSTLDKPDTDLQGLYRQLMDEFNGEQAEISYFQHRSDRPLDFVNQSGTEAYQNASYMMERHIFSNEKPSDEQLWIDKATTIASTKLSTAAAKDLVIDTRQYPSMRKEDAIASASYLESMNNEPASEGEPSNFMTQAKIHSDQITQQSQITKERLGAKANPVSLRTEKDSLSRQSVKKQTPQGNWHQQLDLIFKNSEKAPEHVSADEDVNKQAKIADAQFIDGTERISAEKPVQLYMTKDLFTAIGYAGEDIGKYFEREMGSKHPAVSTAFFVVAAATFGAAGLAGHGIGAMESLLKTSSKLLTLDGKTKLCSPERMQSIIQAISDEWLKLTYSQESIVHTIIMDVIALPKLTYLAGDTLFNASENKDTISQLLARFGAQNLEYLSPEELKKNKTQKFLLVVAMLTAAIGVGIGANLAIQTKSFHALGAGVGMFMNVPTQIFANLVGANTVPQELVALVSALLVAKTAGFFLGKMVLVLSHMKGVEAGSAQYEAALFMAALKEHYDNSPESFPNFDTLESRGDFQYYRAHFEDLMDKNTEIEHLFGADFLNKMGVTKLDQSLSAAFKKGFSSGISAMGKKIYAALKTYLWERSFKTLLYGFILGVPMLLIESPVNLFRWLKSKITTSPFTRFTLNQSIRAERHKLALSGALLLTFVIACVKFATISAGGFLLRTGLAVLDFATGVALTINYFLRNIRSNPKQTLLDVTTAALMFIPKIALGIATFAGSIIAGLTTIVTALTSPITWLACKALAVIDKKLNAKGEQDYSSRFDISLADIAKSPLNLSNFLEKKLTAPWRLSMKKTLASIDSRIQQAKGAADIQWAGDQVILGVSRGYRGIKETLGRLAYTLRSWFIRSKEGELQDIYMPSLAVSAQEAQRQTTNSLATAASKGRGVVADKTAEPASRPVNNEATSRRSKPAPFKPTLATIAEEIEEDSKEVDDVAGDDAGRFIKGGS